MLETFTWNHRVNSGSNAILPRLRAIFFLYVESPYTLVSALIAPVGVVRSKLLLLDFIMPKVDGYEVLKKTPYSPLQTATSRDCDECVLADND